MTDGEGEDGECDEVTVICAGWGESGTVIHI